MASDRVGYTAGGSVAGVGGVIVLIAVTVAPKGSDIAHNGLFWPGVGIAGIGFLIVIVTGGNHLVDVSKGVLGKRHQKVTPLNPVRTYRTPGHMGSVSAGVGIVLDPESKTPRVKDMSHGPMFGGYQSGDLPVYITSEGPSGNRDMTSPQEVWVWHYENVTIVNQSDEYLTFHVWLVVKTSDSLGIRELKREPNTVVTLTPHETKQEDFTFRLPLMGFTEDEALHPGSPTELQLIEDSSTNRTRLIDYREQQEP